MIIPPSDKIDYMRRALQLAAHGLGCVSPNPMVGAVIVAPDGRIIGEGFHRRYGQAHAEVNAVNSVRPSDLRLLGEATIYVTLEPCSHYGKTPPCANLLLEAGIPNVVVGALDPFDEVNGSGIDILRRNGVNVEVGLLGNECKSLNARFFTAHTLKRPFVLLKWAQSLDGFMDCRRTEGQPSYLFSTPVGTALVHRLRANFDAIAVGANTDRVDRPRLNVRHWVGRDPRRIVFNDSSLSLSERLAALYREGVTSLMVEGGPTLLRSFIDAGLWDAARVEVSECRLTGEGTAEAPGLPSQPVLNRSLGATNTVYYYSNNMLANKYFFENGL